MAWLISKIIDIKYQMIRIGKSYPFDPHTVSGDSYNCKTEFWDHISSEENLNGTFSCNTDILH